MDFIDRYIPVRAFISALGAALLIPLGAAAAEPSDLIFTQDDSGRYIYCNNHEAVRSVDLADNSNRAPKYIMNNESLTADKYALFLSFMNRTDITENKNLESFTASSRGFDIELDVMFKAREDTVITLSRLGFEVPEHHSFFLNGTEYTAEDEWGCFYCWSSYLGMPIRQINSGNSFNVEPIKETVINIAAGETVWLSEYIENYREVPFCRSVNIMADFSIDSGVCDVNVLAVRSRGIIGDRSTVNPSPAFGSYYRDRQYNGISDGLNRVTAELSYTIDDSEPSGSLLPVTVYNQSNPDGNTLTNWYTHLNPRADPWSYELCAESDMISLTYFDPLKLHHYGSGVPEEERTAYYTFDTKHADTAAYENGYGNRSSYVPNRELTDEDDTDIACNLGNYGVIYDYRIKITNNGNKLRYLTYRLCNTSNNIVWLDDSSGNLVNGCAYSKGYHSESVTDNMACMAIPAQASTEYTVHVVLTPNYTGGMKNSLLLTDYPQIIETYETERSELEKDRYFTGREFYKWDGRTLMMSDDRKAWRSIALPDTVINDIAGNVSEYALTFTGNGYVLRPSLYDAGVYSHADGLFRDVYVFDENFTLIKSQNFGSYPQDMVCANGVWHAKLSGSVFRSDGLVWWDLVQTAMPCYNYGRFAAQCENGTIRLSADGTVFDPVEYLGFAPEYIDSYGKYYYFTDGRALYLSQNGIYWGGVMAKEKARSFEVSDGTVVINGYETHPLAEFGIENETDGSLVIKYNGKYIGTEHAPIVTDGVSHIPLREFSEFMGAEVEWNDGLITVTLDGDRAVIDTDTDADVFILDGTSYVPLRRLAELLDCTVSYDENTNIAELSRQSG